MGDENETVGKSDRKGAEKMARGVVAPGRTVSAPHPTKTVIKGLNPETGKPIIGPLIVDHGPGTEVTLPESEIRSFRAQGFLIDQAKVAETTPAEGSHVSEIAS